MPHTTSRVVEVEQSPTLSVKRLRSSTQSENESSQPEPSPIRSNATLRTLIRTATYFAYDGVSVTAGHKEIARIAKVIVELAVDEKLPAPRRHEMSLFQKCTEFLLAPAVSSLCWFIISRFQAMSRSKQSNAHSEKWLMLWAKAAWAFIYRIGKQAIIYRLFFRIGSLGYSLASALGIVCCFFRETVFRDIYRLHLWPQHFSFSQGLSATLRSLLYALSFSIPLHRLSEKLVSSPRRRGNVKKLIFAMILSQANQLVQLRNYISSAYLAS